MDTSYAIVSVATNVCINIIVWNSITEYTPPDGTFMVLAENASIGWVWNGTELVDPNVPEPTTD